MSAVPSLAPFVGVLCNPRARGAARDAMLPDRLRRIVGGAGVVLTTWDPSDLPAAIEVARRAGANTFAVCGGDGALMYALSALHAVFGADLPPISVLPAGTVNTVARTLGQRGSAEASLRRLVSGLERGQTLPVAEHSTLRVTSGELTRIGFIFGTGLVSSFFELYNETEGSGRLWAASQIARIFAGSFVGSSFASRIIAPVAARVVADGAPCPLERFTLLLASTLVDVGLGLRVTYRAGSAPGRFHMVGTDLPASRLGPQLPRVLAGRPLHAEPLLDLLAHEARLDFGEGGGSYLLDGEIERATSVGLALGPRIGFVVP